MLAEWHYARNGIRCGPIQAEDLLELIRAGRVGAQDWVWREGMVDWMRACAVPNFSDEIQPSPARDVDASWLQLAEAVAVSRQRKTVRPIRSNSGILWPGRLVILALIAGAILWLFVNFSDDLRIAFHQAQHRLQITRDAEAATQKSSAPADFAPTLARSAPPERVLPAVSERDRRPAVDPYSVRISRAWWADRMDGRNLGWSSNNNGQLLVQPHLFIEVQVTNNTDEPLSPPRIALSGGTKRIFAPSLKCAFADDAYQQIHFLNPGVMEIGVLVFDLPKSPYWMRVEGRGSIYVETE